MKFSTSRIAAVLALSMLLVPLAALAQEVKIGFVDREKALFSTESGKKVFAELKSKAAAAEGQLKPLQDQMEALQKEIEAKKFVLSQDALRELQAKLLGLQNQYQNKGKELEGQLKIDQARLIGPLEEKLNTVIDALGKEQGYTMILERQVRQVILYSREQHDITDLVVSRFNSAK
jgi:outer membrane protein